MQDEKIQTVPEDNIAKYTIKDSVFSDLFKIKKYPQDEESGYGNNPYLQRQERIERIP